MEEYTTVLFKRHTIPVTVIDKMGKDSDGRQWYIVESDIPNTNFEDGLFGDRWQCFDCTEDEPEEIKE